MELFLSFLGLAIDVMGIVFAIMLIAGGIGYLEERHTVKEREKKQKAKQNKPLTTEQRLDLHTKWIGNASELAINNKKDLNAFKIDIDMLKTFKRFLTKELADYVSEELKNNVERDKKIDALTQELDRAFTMIKAIKDETPKAKRPKAK